MSIQKPVTSRLARQLIASAPGEARQLNDELCGQAWTEEDVCWLQNELAKRFGYVIVDWTRPSQRQVEYTAIDLHRRTCLERKWPLVVVFLGLHYCAIQIDLDTTMRPTEQRMGGLTVQEQAAIDALMATYRREWGDSPVLRRYGRVPHRDAHTVAQRILSWLVGSCDRTTSNTASSSASRAPPARMSGRYVRPKIVSTTARFCSNTFIRMSGFRGSPE